MTEEDFWALIGVLDGVADEQSVARLVDRLGGREEEFQQRVDEAVRDLDGARFHLMPILDESDPDDADGVPLTGTALESFLLAVVAAGPRVYRAVCSDPAVVMTRRWSFGAADYRTPTRPGKSSMRSLSGRTGRPGGSGPRTPSRRIRVAPTAPPG